jgi:hypothetical protein
MTTAMNTEKKPTDKRPISWADVEDIEYIDAYKKIEIVDGDWHLPEERFYRSHGMLSGVIQANMTYRLYPFVEDNALGQVYAGSLSFVLEGNRDNIQLMRLTDVSFVRKAHVLTENRDEPYYRAPDLAVEVVFRDFADDMFQRIEDFLSHGTEQVWVVAPSPQIVWVYLQDGTAKAYPYRVVICYRDLR